MKVWSVLEIETPHNESYGVTTHGAEILLRHGQMCNLSSIVARPDDTVETLIEKTKVATILGTIQSMATNFKGLRQIWQDNCNEERLLGVDVSGQMDCPVFRNADVMATLKPVSYTHLTLPTIYSV